MRPLVVDNFAGGGGASLGIEQALGIVDVAINHDVEAIAMHQANHPRTYHYLQDITQVDPRQVARGRDVRLAWFSPDCKHFSKAKGGKPVEKRIRDLAWVVLRWAKWVHPDVIMLENVEEFITWCPLGGDGRPDMTRKGETFRLWVRQLERWGYKVEWRELRACDYGAPTSRKRLFVVARCDGRPIVWPGPTHGPGLQPYRVAADIVQWWRKCASIFRREKPLKPATMARIYRLIHQREPFFLPIEEARPANRALVASWIAQHNGGMTGHSVNRPLSTVTQSGSQQQLVMAWLMKYYRTDQNPRLSEPLPTTTTRDRFALLTAYGEHYSIADIGMRMFVARELFSAQGFPESYIIDPILNGRPLTKTAQVRCCGNSVCPPLARALVQANVDLETRRFWRVAC